MARDFKNATDKALIVKIALQSLKDHKFPYILLISRTFLDEIWSSAEKSQILKVLMNYSTKNCLHIWLDNLEENDVEKYSTFLLRNDCIFRRISYTKLTLDHTEELVKEILELLAGKRGFPLVRLATGTGTGTGK